MSDKKVGRLGGRPVTPTEQMQRALSDPGTVNTADLRHDKGKAAVADKFREREERFRREQALQDQRAAQPQAGEPAKGEERGEGGAG